MSKYRESGLQLPIVDFLDTSVFVEILDVPYMNDHRADVLAEMEARLKAKVRFVLPTATVVETGNHVFQIKDGAARRTRAVAFMSMLRKTALGEAPWVLHERTWGCLPGRAVRRRHHRHGHGRACGAAATRHG
ncbi:hypothetical protein QF026_005176 [Streptomyces aurantiacus]|uniref:hypothetical protein n=1 Tax=Streptomyces aurantiacus TaxID=47760 RepID=UPI002792E380|nr:hypothetical protein [Streptomyces aurantiacus]MDQ0776710.1 hypothetical protein [Streptomyces aurantiacus]